MRICRRPARAEASYFQAEFLSVRIVVRGREKPDVLPSSERCDVGLIIATEPERDGREVFLDPPKSGSRTVGRHFFVFFVLVFWLRVLCSLNEDFHASTGVLFIEVQQNGAAGALHESCNKSPATQWTRGHLAHRSLVFAPPNSSFGEHKFNSILRLPKKRSSGPVQSTKQQKNKKNKKTKNKKQKKQKRKNSKENGSTKLAEKKKESRCSPCVSRAYRALANRR